MNVEAMNTQPEALRLANELDAVPEKGADPDVIQEAAAELRRLQAENERLHQINQSHEMKLSVRGYEIQIKDLKAVNAELLQVVVDALEIFEFGNDDKTVVAPNWVARARAASRQWLLTEPLRRGEIMSIEAMKQALDALEGWAGHGKWIYPESALEQAKKNTSEALPVLRAAIQQAEEQEKQEGWVLREVLFADGEAIAHREPEKQDPAAIVVDAYDTPGLQWFCQHPPKRGDRLYTAPQPTAQREWRGLTKEERKNIWSADQMTQEEWDELFDTVETKLKEKNT